MSKKSQVKAVEGADAKITLNIFSPGHKPKEIKITIPNIDGAANLLNRSPEAIAAAITEGLRVIFGGRVE